MTIDPQMPEVNIEELARLFVSELVMMEKY
jgi:hypothetical protein